MNATTFAVSGMSCGHCARAVETHLAKVSGVTGVDVDLAAGHVTVTSDVPVERDVLRGAVEAAGYRLGA